MHVSADRF